MLEVKTIFLIFVLIFILGRNFGVIFIQKRNRYLFAIGFIGFYSICLIIGFFDISNTRVDILISGSLIISAVYMIAHHVYVIIHDNKIK